MSTLERRFSSTEIRLVDVGMASGPVAEGYAATYFRRSSDLGGFKEKIHQNAFRETLRSGDDVYCLFNHSADAPLGRLRNKTLELSSDSKGLKMRCALPSTSTGNDVAKLLARGDLDQMSFAFSVAPGGDSWGEEDDCECGDPNCNDPNCERSRIKVRTLHNVRLHDVSIVQAPAYPGTSVGVHAASIDPGDVHVSSMDRSRSIEDYFPFGVPAEVRSHVDVRRIQTARNNRRRLTDFFIGM